MNATQYGLALSISFAGLTLGSAVAGPWIKKLLPGRVYALGFVTMGVTTILIGLIPSVLSVYAFSALRSFGNGLIIVAFTTLIQSHADERSLGRVFSTMTILSEGARPLSVITGSWLAEMVGSQYTIVISSFFFLAASAMALANNQLRNAGITTPQVIKHVE
jgi:MFS family permease